MKSVQGRADALAYWVVSDHFEELGRPPALFHGGFGLMTVGGLRKPRWWALHLAESLGPNLVEAQLEGDGAGSLVECWATRGDDGTVRVLLWNGTLEQAKLIGDPLLDRVVQVRVDGRYEASVARIDFQHSNIARHWTGERDWPTPDEWKELRSLDVLAEEPLGVVDGELEVQLPMPSVVRLRLIPR
jgi:xylan 1,4-beta-xylosidase